MDPTPPQLFGRPIIVLDTETTGIPHRDHWTECVEWAAVLLDRDGTELDHFSALIRPAYTGPEIQAALDVNHLTLDILMSQMPLAEVLPSISGWLRKHGDPYCTAFNVGFDSKICTLMGLNVRWASCTMLRAMGPMGAAGALQPGRYGKPKWPRLAEACAHFEIPQQEPAHRALADARSAALVACAIRRAELAATPTVAP